MSPLTAPEPSTAPTSPDALKPARLLRPLSRLRRRATAFGLMTLAAVPGPLVSGSAPFTTVPGGPAADSGPGQVASGNWAPQDPASSQVHAAAAFAVRMLDEEFAHRYVVEDITTAETRISSGTDYRLALRIAQLQDDVLGTRKICTVLVHRPLSPQAAEQLTSFDCQSSNPQAAVAADTVTM